MSKGDRIIMKRLAWLAALAMLAVACSPQSAPDAPTATTQPLPSESAGPTAPTTAPQQVTREQVVLPQPDDWVRGPDTASVTFIEWGDFQ
jgi:hypothetical protein